MSQTTVVYSKRSNVLLIIVLLVVVALIFFLMRSCGNEKTASIAYGNIRDSLEKVVKAKDSIEVSASVLRGRLQDAKGGWDWAIELKNHYEILFNKAADRAENLNRQLQKATQDKDTIEIVKIADSCCSDNIALLELRNKEKLASDSAIASSERKFLISDSLSKHWESAYISCLSAVVFSSEELPKIEPKGKGYFTAGGFSSGPSFGVSGGVTYITKRGLLIAGKGILGNYGFGGMVEVGVPLSFKRK